MTESKRILIVAPGGRGDFSPYHGLGVRLQAAGHQVTLAGDHGFRGMTEAFGLNFFQLSGDAREAHQSEEVVRWQESDYGVQGAVQGVKVVKSLANDVCGHGLEILDAAKRGTDVMIVTLLGAIGFHVAESLGIPPIPAFVGPTEPTGEYPPPGIKIGRSLGRWGNRAMYSALGMIMHSASKDQVGRLRSELGLAPLRRRDIRTGDDLFFGYSPQLAPKPHDWPQHAKVVGYWWPATVPGWRPSAELTEFLAAGPPPVFITFGSNSGRERGEQLSDIVTGALRRAGVRGVVQAGWAGLDVKGDDVLTVSGDIDYEWLMPQVAAAVHHSGCGTTGAVARAGVPQVPVPMMADQDFWADRATKAGISPGPVPFPRLTAEKLGDAIRAAVSDPAYRRRAEAVAARIAEEDGAAHMIDVVNRIG